MKVKSTTPPPLGRIAVALLLVTVSMSLVAQGQTKAAPAQTEIASAEAEALKQHEIAVKLQAQGLLREALTAFQRAFELDPIKQIDCLYRIGAIEEHQGKGADALSTYMNYIGKAPDGRHAERAKQRIFELSKDCSNTRKLTALADFQPPESDRQLFDRAIKLQDKHDFDEAITAYKDLMARNPTEAAYPYALGTCHHTKGDIETASEYYQKALVLQPHRKELIEAVEMANEMRMQPFLDRATKEQKAGNNSQAIEFYQKALSISPRAAATWMNLGTCYQTMSKLKECAECYRKSLELDRVGCVDALFYLGTAEETQKNRDAAVARYEQYLAEAPAGVWRANAGERIKALKNRSGTTSSTTENGSR